MSADTSAKYFQAFSGDLPSNPVVTSAILPHEECHIWSSITKNNDKNFDLFRI